MGRVPLLRGTNSLPPPVAHPLNRPRAVSAPRGSEDIVSNRTLTAIRGVRVGHAQDLRRRTGTTVVLLDPPAMAFADARADWPGTYDTAASDLGKTFIERHALLLTGRSEEHTSELQSQSNLVCRLLLEK